MKSCEKKTIAILSTVF